MKKSLGDQGQAEIRKGISSSQALIEQIGEGISKCAEQKAKNVTIINRLIAENKKLDEDISKAVAVKDQLKAISQK